MSNDEWETPLELFNGIQERWGIFNLDVCATSETKKCEKYYDKETDGLAQDWDGIVWCNPPYSNQKPWVIKAGESVKDGQTEVLMLIPMNPETKYFQEHILRKGSCVKAIYIIGGRIPFLRDGKRVGSPKFGSCLVHFKNNPMRKIDFYVCDRTFDNIKCVG